MTTRTIALLGWLAACGGPSAAPDAAVPDASPDAGPPVAVRVGVFSAESNRALDVLFVIDNSGSMEEEQNSLALHFPEFLDALQSLDGVLPDLHLGVASSDMGAGPFNISNCSGFGDNGQLQTQARVTGCSPPTNSYISDVSDGAGGRTTNYTGTLAETFSCIAQLGINGCGFEQHLESMRRALNGSNAFNNGFLRAEANLLIVTLADEDDCSTLDTQMFDTSQNSVSDPLGPLASFRCFEFGVQCAVGNVDPRAEGPREDCRGNEDSEYMHVVSGYVRFLRSLKSGPQVMVSAIIGDPVPVEVGRDPEQPQNPWLVPSCSSAAGISSPGVRLADLVGGFPSRAQVLSICNEDLSGALRETAYRAVEATGTTCLAGELAGDLATLESACTVSDVVALDSADEQRASLPPCATNGGAAPCFRFEVDTRCRFNDAQASVVVERAVTPPAGTVIVVDCAQP